MPFLPAPSTNVDDVKRFRMSRELWYLFSFLPQIILAAADHGCLSRTNKKDTALSNFPHIFTFTLLHCTIGLFQGRKMRSSGFKKRCGHKQRRRRKSEDVETLVGGHHLS